MAKAYSLDLRERILKNYDAGVPVEDVAAQFDVSRSWVYSLVKQRRETGSIAPRRYRPGRKQKLAPYEKEVRKLVADQPDATLVEYCNMLSEHVSVSTAALCEFLRHLKITRKKRPSALPSGIDRMSRQNARNGKSCKK